MTLSSPTTQTDGRTKIYRRDSAVQDAAQSNDDSQVDRTPKPQRRRQIDPTTCERDYSNDEVEFMQALDLYKRTAGRMFPTCSEILEVVRSLGYVKLGVETDATIGESVNEEYTDETATSESFAGFVAD